MLLEILHLVFYVSGKKWDQDLMSPLWNYFDQNKTCLEDNWKTHQPEYAWNKMLRTVLDTVESLRFIIVWINFAYYTPTSK